MRSYVPIRPARATHVLKARLGPRLGPVVPPLLLNTEVDDRDALRDSILRPVLADVLLVPVGMVRALPAGCAVRVVVLHVAELPPRGVLEHRVRLAGIDQVVRIKQLTLSVATRGRVLHLVQQRAQRALRHVEPGELLVGCEQLLQRLARWWVACRG